jgi:hypothetical protein
MFEDTVLQDLVFHHLSKIGAGLVLLIVWWLYIKGTIRDWAKRTQEAREADNKTAPDFPFISLVLMVALTFGYGYYVVMEHSFRSTEGVSSEMIEDRNAELEQRSEDYVAPEPSPRQETLEEKTERMVDQNRADNEEAKKAFRNLPKVRANEQGGAEAVMQK